jgi:hypothetical protein
VLALTGLRFPRGLLGAEAWALAAALAGGREADARDLVRTAAAALWPALKTSVQAAVERAALQVAEKDGAAFATVLEWARSDDLENPLALSLALQAGSDLSAALTRTAARLDAVADAVGTEREPGAVGVAAGLIAVDLLDLDPEDFEPEIAAYVQAEETVEALRELARATGDEDVRVWARETVAALELPDAEPGLSALRAFAGGPMPPDPADDGLWVATIQTLADAAIAFVLASDPDAE